MTNVIHELDEFSAAIDCLTHIEVAQDILYDAKSAAYNAGKRDATPTMNALDAAIEVLGIAQRTARGLRDDKELGVSNAAQGE